MLVSAVSKRSLSTLIVAKPADWVIPPISERERDKQKVVEKRVLNCVLRPFHPGVCQKSFLLMPVRSPLGRFAGWTIRCFNEAGKEPIRLSAL